MGKFRKNGKNRSSNGDNRFSRHRACELRTARKRIFWAGHQFDNPAREVKNARRANARRAFQFLKSTTLSRPQQQFFDNLCQEANN